jgi:hypothetical protein
VCADGWQDASDVTIIIIWFHKEVYFPHSTSGWMMLRDCLVWSLFCVRAPFSHQIFIRTCMAPLKLTTIFWVRCRGAYDSTRHGGWDAGMISFGDSKMPDVGLCSYWGWCTRWQVFVSEDSDKQTQAKASEKILYASAPNRCTLYLRWWNFCSLSVFSLLLLFTYIDSWPDLCAAMIRTVCAIPQTYQGGARLVQIVRPTS